MTEKQRKLLIEAMVGVRERLKDVRRRREALVAALAAGIITDERMRELAYERIAALEAEEIRLEDELADMMEFVASNIGKKEVKEDA
jgi:hypothetical protein